MDAFCAHCRRDKNHNCRILAATFGHGVDDPGYPKEWIEDADGPRCTAFTPYGTPVKRRRPRDNCTMNLFGKENLADGTKQQTSD